MAEQLDRLKTALADRYAIQEELGAGGMATVYLAEDRKHHRQVAVKVLRPELAAVLGAERFVQEIETTANLQHPHILPLFDSGEADGFLYYVMPFIDGETVRDKLNHETQFGIDEAVGITADIADALDYAHRHNVIHRDIKPENILLHDGRPVVADFGIALAVSAAAGGRMTETGLSLGTPHYMSPEQATAEKDLTNRSDIYSLGCVLYEMLTGEPPHTGASAQAIVMKIVTEDVQPVTDLRKTVPPHVAAATGKALEKLAADRFATAKEFAEALTNTAFTLATVQSAVAAVSAQTPWNRLSVVTTGIAVVLAALLGLALTRPDAASPVARYTLKSPASEPLLGAIGLVAMAPDGSRFAYVDRRDGGSGQIWVHELGELAPTPLPGTGGGGTRALTFSPDGRRIAYVQNSRITVMAVAGGPAVTLSDSAITIVGGLDWGPDGYVYLGATGLLRIASSGGGQLERVVPQASSGWHLFPGVLPNGKGALFTVGGNEWTGHTMAVVDFATGRVRELGSGVEAHYLPTGHLVYVRTDGVLMAAPFDQDKMELTGPAEPMVGGIGIGYFGTTVVEVSETGTLLYVSGVESSDPTQVVWVLRDGTVQEVDPAWRGDFGHLALSPDGSQLAVTNRESGGAHIWVKQLDRGRLDKLTLEGLVNTNPAWTRDGLSVRFVSDGNFYVTPVDRSGGRTLLARNDRGVGMVDWSPDGQLVFSSGGPALDILTWRPGADSVPIPLLAEQEFDEWGVSLSPDGRWLAYNSDENGQRSVYVRDFPSGDNPRLVSIGGGQDPKWAHSGRELFYFNLEQEMVAAEVLPGATFAIGEQRVLFRRDALSNLWWDVAPDDQRFIFVQNLTAASGSDLIRVENFFEEVKAKVRNE